MSRFLFKVAFGTKNLYANFFQFNCTARIIPKILIVFPYVIIDDLKPKEKYAIIVKILSYPNHLEFILALTPVYCTQNSTLVPFAHSYHQKETSHTKINLPFQNSSWAIDGSRYTDREREQSGPFFDETRSELVTKGSKFL